MKRSLVLTLALSLAAVLMSLPSAGAQNAAVRATPVSVSAKTTPTRDRRSPYTFTTTGRVTPPGRYCAPNTNPTGGAGNCIPIKCPAGATDPKYCTFPGRGVICSGKVAIRFQKRTTTVSSRNVTLRPDCTYRSKVTFRIRNILRRGVLKVRARFQGNTVMGPRVSSTKTVRAG